MDDVKDLPNVQKGKGLIHKKAGSWEARKKQDARGEREGGEGGGWHGYQPIFRKDLSQVD